MKIQHRYYLWLIIIIINISCKKEAFTLVDSNKYQKKSIQIYKNYIDSISTKEILSKHILSKLNWSRMCFQEIDSFRRMTLIPSNLINNNNKLTAIIIIESKINDSIIQSAIVQFESKEANINYDLNENYAINILVNYFNRSFYSFIGRINFFNINNNFLFTIGYNQKNKYIKTIIKKRNNITDRNIMTNSNCTDYYLTTFYDDGSTETEFIYQLCENDCIQMRTINLYGEIISTMSCDELSNNHRSGSNGDNYSAINNLLDFINGPGDLTLISRTINKDGSITYKFLDKSSFFLSPAIFTFTLGANNRIIPGSESLEIAGIFSFNNSSKGNDYNPDVGTNIPFDGFIYSSFTMNGILTIMNSFSVHVNIVVLINLSQNQYLPTYGHASYGYFIPLINKTLR